MNCLAYNSKSKGEGLLFLFLHTLESLKLPKLYVGEGNGSPLHYSCLENPIDGGAWEAAVHGVAKSRTGLLLLLSRFSRVRLCATSQTVAHQVPPSLGFSRQEHWSGLPFPSPVHESEK